MHVSECHAHCTLFKIISSRNVSVKLGVIRRGAVNSSCVFGEGMVTSIVTFEPNGYSNYVGKGRVYSIAYPALPPGTSDWG